MSGIDWTILIAYMAVVLGIGFWSGKNSESEDDYFQGGRSLPWFAVAISIGMTRVSAGGFIGTPGWAYKNGLMAGMIMYALPLALVFATYTLLPIIYHSGVTTIGEYLKLRFGNRTRLTVVLIWLVNSLVLIGGFVYTPALVLEAITGVPFNVWVPVMVVLSIIYTVIGGIKAVVWTDTIQGFILSFGVIIFLFLAMSKMGIGFTDMLTTIGDLEMNNSFDLGFDWSSGNIWLALVGGFMCWVSYFGFNQEQVQRYVTADSMKSVKKTTVLSTAIMQGIYWVCYFLGLSLVIFYKTNAPTLDLSNVNNVIIDFMLNHTPVGLLGIMVACVFAAAMSSLDSILNSATAVFVKDIYEPFFAKGKEATLKQSMLFTCAIGVVVVIFVYLYLGESLGAITKVIAMIGAPFQGVLSGMMLLTLFFPKVNDKGCAYGSGLAIVAAVAFNKTIAASLGMHWAWTYVYSGLFAIVFSIIISGFFKDKEETERAFPYTLVGARVELKGKTDSEGVSLAPLELDRYAYITLGMFALHMVFLAWVQTF